MRPVFIKTFGCKVNYSESLSLGDLLREAGFTPLEISSAREIDAEEEGSSSDAEPSMPSADEVERPVVFINSCCVTQEAERKAAQFVRRVKRQRPDSEVLFTGCGARNYATREQYAQAGARVFNFYPEAFAWLQEHHPGGTGPGPARGNRQSSEVVLPKTSAQDQSLAGSPVSRVLRPASLPGNILDAASTATEPRTQDPGRQMESPTQRLPTGVVGEARSRAFLKVQDGCHNCCSFCIIPFVRPYVSRPFDEVLAEAQLRLSSGYREIVLTGVNIGHYGLTPIAPLNEVASAQHFKRSKLYERIPGHATLWDLIDALLALLDQHYERSGVAARLRISSIEPEEIEARFFEQLAHPRMCPHLHLPLQSGSDKVLSDMRRLYDLDTFMQRVGAFRRACPLGALTTDIITGYPTESEADFEATMDACSAAGFERLHGFPFSPRPGTRAAMLPQHKEAASVAQERNRRLIEHCAQIADQRWPRFVGSTAEVLVEEVRAGRLHGHGEAYQLVSGEVPAGIEHLDLVGSILPMNLISYAQGQFRAAQVESPQHVKPHAVILNTA